MSGELDRSMPLGFLLVAIPDGKEQIPLNQIYVFIPKHRMESEKHFKHKFTHFDTPCSKLDERRYDNAYKLKMNNSEDQI